MSASKGFVTENGKLILCYWLSSFENNPNFRVYQCAYLSVGFHDVTVPAGGLSAQHCDLSATGSVLVLPTVTVTDGAGLGWAGGGCERAFTCLVVAKCKSSDCVIIG